VARRGYPIQKRSKGQEKEAGYKNHKRLKDAENERTRRNL
jgi:hypothetical protein